MTSIDASQRLNGAQPLAPARAETDDDGSHTLLPGPSLPSFAGNAVTMLAALLTQADNRDRDEARVAESQADSSAVKEENDRIQAMREKADQDERAGYVQGFGTMAGGLCTVGSGLTTNDPWRTGLQGLGQMGSGGGTVIAAPFKMSADNDDATAAMHDARAQGALRRYDTANQDAQAADGSIDKVEQLLQNYIETKKETATAAASVLKG